MRAWPGVRETEWDKEKTKCVKEQNVASLLYFNQNICDTPPHNESMCHL